MDVEICKACLATESKVILISNTELKKSYTSLSKIKISPKYRLLLCYECINMFKMLQVFQKTCSSAEKVLKEYHKRIKSGTDEDKGECLKLLQWQHKQIKSKQNTSFISSGYVRYTENDKIYSIEDSKAIGDFKEIALKTDIDVKECSDDVEIRKKDMNSLPLSAHGTNCNADDHKNITLIDTNASHIAAEQNVNMKTENGYNDFVTNGIIEFNHYNDGDMEYDDSLEDFDSKVQLYKHEENNMCSNQLTGDNTNEETKFKDDGEEREGVGKSEKDKKRSRKHNNKNKSLKKVLKDIKVKSDDTTTKDIVCLFCKKTYSTESKLKEHQRKYHASKRYACTECHRSFKHNYELKTHTNRHTGERPYICDQCGNKFISRWSLWAHLKSHGPRTFECDYCGKKFFRKNELILHIHIHFGEKNQICDICGKGFKLKCNLLSHKRIHANIRPHGCPVCGKRFVESSVARRHIFMHTGQKPFSCKTCDLKFPLIAALHQHEKVHSDVKPYKCDLCSYSGKSRSYLKKHKSRHASRSKKHNQSQ